jgi:predicted nucleic acid-binding protein
MILADSSIWIEHFRSPVREMIELAAKRLLYCHPSVIGELACGNLSDRKNTLQFLKQLHRAPVARNEDVLEFIEAHKLIGRGVGYTDVQLLASTAIMKGSLWTRDRRLKEAAESLGLSY